MNEKLEGIKPKTRKTVLRILEELKFNTSEWYNTTGYPACNPKYCYRWAFLDEPTGEMVFCLWFKDLRIDGDTVYCLKNMEESRDNLKTSGPAVIGRMEEFYKLLELAARNKSKFRVMLSCGVGSGTRIYLRDLNPDFWEVIQDETDFLIRKC